MQPVYKELDSDPTKILTWYLTKRTIEGYKILLQHIRKGKFKPNKRNKDIWDRFIEHYKLYDR